MDVLSVGGFGGQGRVAGFSSRGMTTSDLISGGMGRVKPDVLAPSINLYSSSGAAPYRCVTLTGTSVATPVVTGAVAVLLSYAFDPLKFINSSISESSGKGNMTRLNRSNSSYPSVLTESIIYNRKSPKFLRLKNIAAVKQIILSSSKPSPVPGKQTTLSIHL
jgi:subtilisin family serine protease